MSEMSNYEIMKLRMEKEFLRYDQEKMIRKFHLKNDPTYLYIVFFSRMYRINRTTGKVSWSEDDFQTETSAEYEDAMTLYDILCNSKEDCRPSGKYVNMMSLSTIKGGSMPLGSGLFHNKEKVFDQKAEALKAACEKMGGTPYGKGDVSYKIPMLEDLYLVFQYWNSDEEFPASLQIFPDENLLSYMRYETMWFAVMYMVHRLEISCLS